MQVNHQIIHQQKTLPDAPLELKQGEVYRASIKEKINDTDAILNIRGKEVHARFSDGVPTSENRVAIQVNGQSDKLVNVKTITTENVKTASSEEKIFTSLGFTGKESPHVKQAVSILLDKGAPLSKEIVGELKTFLEKTPGTLDAKLETVRALANKRLEATGTQLRAVHEALNGKPLNQVLSDIAKEIDPEFKLEKTETINARQQNPIPKKDSASTSKVIETQQVVLNRLSNNVTEGITPSQSIQSASENNDTELSNLVRKNLEFIEKEPDLKKAIDQIKKEIVENPKIDSDLARKVEKAALEAEKLQSIGKERLANHASQLDQAGRDRLMKMLQQVETILKQNQTKPSESINQALKQLQKEPNLEKALAQVRRENTSNPNIGSKLIDIVQKALDQATQLQY